MQYLWRRFIFSLCLRNGSKGKVDHGFKEAVSVVFDGDAVLLHVDGGETANGVLAADRLIDSAVNLGDVDLALEGDSQLLVNGGKGPAVSAPWGIVLYQPRSELGTSVVALFIQDNHLS